jgi:type I restriction enzyme S subunit
VQTSAYKDKINLIKQGGNGALANLYGKDILGLSFFIPTEPAEQEKIADCLSAMDELIAVQAEKVEALKEKKTGLMQQLFPQPGETTPRLRFPEFTGEWEEKSVGDCLEERNEQFSESSEYPLMAFVADKGVSPKGEKYDRSALVKDANKKYKRTEYGDFIYSSNNLESGSIGFNKYGSATISPVYSIFKSRNNVNPVFIGTLLTQKSFISEMVKYRQGVVYGQWKIPESEFLKIKIFIPQTPTEQEKIASSLSALDDQIAAETEKLTALKDYKKGLMQQLFPQPAK